MPPIRAAQRAWCGTALVEAEPVGVQPGRGGHDRGTTGQQPADDGRSDRTLLAPVTTAIWSAYSPSACSRAASAICAYTCASGSLPAACAFCCHQAACSATTSPAPANRPAMSVSRSAASVEPQPHQVLAAGGPAVVDQDHLLLIEGRCDGARPV